ncbi:MAG TPA: GIY-YIG nuclease family protein [Ktedonobacterales bacterium]|nr:GIY-YIG nuclease family protein [Ktedonobacterales bacterium]
MKISNTLPQEYGIYALIDPTDGLVYYVGQTNDPKRRLGQHLAARHHKGVKAEWLCHLDEKGQKPIMQILEIVIGKHLALAREREWIRHFQAQRMPLLNTPRKPPSKLSLKPVTPLLQDTLFVRESNSQPSTDSDNMSQPENEERRQREERILDASASLLLHWGYHKTTLSDVAREAGVGSVTALHWKNKSELFQAAIRHEGHLLSEDIQQRISADPTGSFFHRVIMHSTLATFSNPLVAAMLKSKSSDFFDEFLQSSAPYLVHQMFVDANTYIDQLQQAGLIRVDLPVSIITFLLVVLKVGLINFPDSFGPEQTPSMEQLSKALSDLIHRWLEPG